MENIFSTRGYYEASEVGEAEALSFNVLTADKTVVPIHGQRIEDTLRGTVCTILVLSRNSKLGL